MKPERRRKIIDAENLSPRLVAMTDDDELDAQMAKRHKRAKCFMCQLTTELDGTGRLQESGWSKDGSSFRCPNHRKPGVANIGEMLQAKRGRK